MHNIRNDRSISQWTWPMQIILKSTLDVHLCKVNPSKHPPGICLSFQANSTIFSGCCCLQVDTATRSRLLWRHTLLQLLAGLTIVVKSAWLPSDIPGPRAPPFTGFRDELKSLSFLREIRSCQPNCDSPRQMSELRECHQRGLFKYLCSLFDYHFWEDEGMEHTVEFSHNPHGRYSCQA